MTHAIHNRYDKMDKMCKCYEKWEIITNVALLNRRNSGCYAKLVHSPFR